MTLKVEIGGNDVSDAILVGAAVVQAIGSIAAIIAVGWFGHRDRIEARRSLMSDRVTGLAPLIFRADEMVKKTYDILAVEGWDGIDRVEAEWRKDKDERTRVEAALRAVPLHELHSWELVSAVMEMIEAMAGSELAVEDFLTGNRLSMLYEAFGPPDLSPLAPSVNKAAEAVARIHNQAHSWSGAKAARKHRIKPRIVA